MSNEKEIRSFSIAGCAESNYNKIGIVNYSKIHGIDDMKTKNTERGKKLIAARHCIHCGFVAMAMSGRPVIR